MKQCQKWWNEKHAAVTTKEFLGKYRSIAIPEQVLDVLVEMTWREALRFVMRRGMHHYGNDFLALDLCKDIRDELEDGN